MSDWIRFEAVRGHRGSEYGTITQDGRLVIVNPLAQKTGIVPGTLVELYYKPDTRMIGIKPAKTSSPYTLKVTSTGMKDGDFTKPTARGSMPQAIVAVKSFLHSRHIGLASKIRGSLYWSDVDGMLIFEIPEPKLMEPSEHVGRQLKNASWPERVAGDTGEAVLEATG